MIESPAEIPRIEKIEKKDIETPPAIPDGGTAIILQRHEAYNRKRGVENSGSLITEAAEAASKRYEDFFERVLEGESGKNTMILFASSDTQYDGNGRRSLETAQLAQDAAIEAMEALGIDPSKQIINLNPDFTTSKSRSTGRDIKDRPGLREPQIFDNPKYIKHLQDKYGAGEMGGGLSQAAFAAHEADKEKEVREKLGAEGVYDIVERTKSSISVFKRYAEAFHKSHPTKKLIIWTASHYDTISPLIKDATNTDFNTFVPVEYGGGVVIDITPGSEEVNLTAQGVKVPLKLGRTASQTALRN